MGNQSKNIPPVLKELLSKSETIKNQIYGEGSTSKIDTRNSNSKDNKVYQLEEGTKLHEEQISILKEELRSKKQDTDERKKYADLTFQFLCWFAIGLFILIFLTGVNANSSAKGFYLSDSVLITLITTSLSTIVGIFIFVMRYLFNNK